MTPRMAIFSFLLGLANASAQRLPLSQESGANLPARIVGVNDLLSITVYGAPELSRTARVGTDGLIRLPMLSERVQVRGLLPAEIENRISEELSREEILVEPVVSVAIAE